ncbi:Coiled-coil-helix-coiled-coil-helix domain-containing protein 7 [Armadillidium nasatum]|uniref:Coiled-coil-helix-coiled-coil-helix domain-containing protein 7 n=1 Tax=Armadillidium nasatum TaxID=96803 RepID=A0A5N5TCQ1_9CRUS|nr:Coiled-coil-helix-coiled-coil-helix domain-containing protein 7 [Armadillidium nasatum]
MSEKDGLSRESKRQARSENATKMMDHSKNPCIHEQKLSMKCLNDNNFDKESCYEFFDNYNKCKDFWGAIQLDRRRKRIRPYLPPVEERETIKKEYMANQHSQS